MALQVGYFEVVKKTIQSPGPLTPSNKPLTGSGLMNGPMPSVYDIASLPYTCRY